MTDKFHTGSLRGIFSHAHVARENDFNFLPPAGGKLCEAFLTRCAARAQALLNQRDFVTPDDLKAIVKPALRHRLTLAAEYEMEGAQVDEVLDDLLRRVAAPRV